MKNKLGKTPEQLKSEKAAYDKARRNGPLKEEIKSARRQYYHDNKETIAPKLKVYRDENMHKHVEYCRRPDQREKEKLRNRKKNGLTDLKICLCCGLEKQKIEFEAYLIFPDKRLYMCKECEDKDLTELNITTREVLQTIRSNLVKTKSVLNIKDIARYPYLIEANKYLLLLKRTTK